MVKHFSMTQAITYAFKTYVNNWRFFGRNFIALLLVIIGIDFFRGVFQPKIQDFRYDLFDLLNFSHHKVFITISWLAIFLYVVYLNKVFFENFSNNNLNVNRFSKFSLNKIFLYLKTSFIYHVITGTLLVIPIFIIETVANTQTKIWFYQFLFFLVGFIMMILPAIYFASKYIVADLISLEKGLTIAQSFRESAQLIYGQISTLMVMFYMFIFILTPAYVGTSFLFFVLWIMSISSLSHLIGYDNLPNYLATMPLKTFALFFIFGLIIPLILLIKVSIYKQLVPSHKVI